MTVLTVVSAGLRDPSSTRLLADRIAVAVAAERELAGTVHDTPAAAPVEGAAPTVEPVEVRHVEVRRHAHAIADALLTGFPSDELAEALADVAEADALVLVTPTFQASFSGLFKSFIDLIEPDAVRGTPVLLAATGGSERHSLVIEHALRPLAAYLGMSAVPTGVYAATADFGGEGTAALTTRIDRAARELRALTAPAAARPAGTHGEGPGQPDPSPVTPFAELLRSVGQ